MFKTAMIANGLFQTFLVHIYCWKFQRFKKDALTRSFLFCWAIKCSFINGSEFRQKGIGTNFIYVQSQASNTAKNPRVVKTMVSLYSWSLLGVKIVGR